MILEIFIMIKILFIVYVNCLYLRILYMYMSFNYNNVFGFSDKQVLLDM